jgi:hypothetical protein
MTKSTLPEPFSSLEPFVAFWAADSSAARAHCRDSSTEEDRIAFHGAMSEQLDAVLEYLDGKRFDEFSESDHALMHLVLSFGHVAMAVELQKEQEPMHAQWRPFMKITHTPADAI